MLGSWGLGEVERGFDSGFQGRRLTIRSRECRRPNSTAPTHRGGRHKREPPAIQKTATKDHGQRSLTRQPPQPTTPPEFLTPTPLRSITTARPSRSQFLTPAYGSRWKPKWRAKLRPEPSEEAEAAPTPPDGLPCRRPTASTGIERESRCRTCGFRCGGEQHEGGRPCSHNTVRTVADATENLATTNRSPGFTSHAISG